MAVGHVSHCVNVWRRSFGALCWRERLVCAQLHKMRKSFVSCCAVVRRCTTETTVDRTGIGLVCVCACFTIVALCALGEKQHSCDFRVVGERKRLCEVRKAGLGDFECEATTTKRHVDVMHSEFCIDISGCSIAFGMLLQLRRKTEFRSGIQFQIHFR